MTPLPLTGGSELPKTQVLIDWISVTFPRSAKANFPEGLTSVYVPCRPFNAYNVGQKFEDGRILLQHTTRPEMGTHVICSGETLRNMPVDALGCLKFFLEHGARVVRLDIAVDALNHGLKPKMATRHIRQGKVKTNAKQFPAWTETGAKGYTQYIGKKSSEICCRIYDKAAEMGVPGDYSRVECVFQAERADKAARQIASGGDMRSLVRGFVDFPKWKQWVEVMEAQPVKLPAERQTSATRKWLLSAAASALARECMFADGDEFAAKFLDAVHMAKAVLEQKMRGNDGN